MVLAFKGEKQLHLFLVILLSWKLRIKLRHKHIRNKTIYKVLVCFQRFEGFQALAIELFLLAVDKVFVDMHESKIAK